VSAGAGERLPTSGKSNPAVMAGSHLPSPCRPSEEAAAAVAKPCVPAHWLRGHPGASLGAGAAPQRQQENITALRGYNNRVLPLDQALRALSETLEARHLRYELVAVGGSGLLLLGLISRATRDLDIVAVVDEGKYVKADPLPQGLLDAVRDVGEVLGIGAEWLNAAPAGLLDLGLPQGFARRTQIRDFGAALVLYLAGRTDQICLKLYAAVDQGPRSKHADDLRVLAPTADELRVAAAWARTHDPSPAFREELRRALQTFGIGDVEL
jgi:hypothetical protein